MSTSAVTASGSSGTSSSVTTDSTSRLPMQTLDQEDFLKLLCTQLSSQDPMNPMKDTEFVAQMAQFTALEQTKSLQSEIKQLREDQQLLRANSLLGQTVTVQNEDMSTVRGVVSAVQIEEGTPKLMVNGLGYDISSVVDVSWTKQ